MKNLQTLSCDDGCLNRSNSIFRHLDSEELGLINDSKTVEQFKRGSVMYRESSRINGCYCIERGIIKVYKTGIDGKEQIIRFAQAGDIIGFRSVLSNELACTSAEVLDDAITCYIPSETLVYLVKNNGNFSIDLMQLTCKELGEANAYITDIAQKTVRERLAEILIHLRNEFGLDDNNILQISLTREELANIVGTATESVIRLLSEFKQDCLIELNGRKIRILDESGLIRIGNVYD
jgi:CRP-like cAMP-binding protein